MKDRSYQGKLERLAARYDAAAVEAHRKADMIRQTLALLNGHLVEGAAAALPGKLQKVIAAKDGTRVPGSGRYKQVETERRRRLVAEVITAAGGEITAQALRARFPDWSQTFPTRMAKQGFLSGHGPVWERTYRLATAQPVTKPTPTKTITKTTQAKPAKQAKQAKSTTRRPARTFAAIRANAHARLTKIADALTTHGPLALAALREHLDFTPNKDFLHRLVKQGYLVREQPDDGPSVYGRTGVPIPEAPAPPKNPVIHAHTVRAHRTWMAVAAFLQKAAGPVASATIQKRVRGVGKTTLTHMGEKGYITRDGWARGTTWTFKAMPEPLEP